MHVLKTLCCAALLTATFAPGARADEYDKKTILTFSGAVQIPGKTLPAGTYVFKLADSSDRHIVRVFDKGEKTLIATLMAIPNQRAEPSDKPVIMFSERPAGSPTGSEGLGTTPVNAWVTSSSTRGLRRCASPAKPISGCSRTTPKWSPTRRTALPWATSTRTATGSPPAKP